MSRKRNDHSKPLTMKLSFVLQAIAGGAVLVLAAIGLATFDQIDPDVGPLTYGVAVVGAAAVVALVLFVAALRGTNGSQRGRTVTTCILLLTPLLLIFSPWMLVAVVPALLALVLLWLPASNTYVRSVAESPGRHIKDLMDSETTGAKIPWANVMPGNPHQQGI